MKISEISIAVKCSTIEFQYVRNMSVIFTLSSLCFNVIYNQDCDNNQGAVTINKVFIESNFNQVKV